jgi:hypothetical protein
MEEEEEKKLTRLERLVANVDLISVWRELNKRFPMN